MNSFEMDSDLDLLAQIRSNAEFHKILVAMGTKVEVGGKNYFFLPYWFEETDNITLKAYSLNGQLPVDLKSVIEKNRDILNDD